MSKLVGVLLLSLLGANAFAAESGEAVFEQRCVFCHSTEPGAHRRGPSLSGVVGRKAGSAAGYDRYSEVMRTSEIVWTPEKLAAYLANPQRLLPGNRMVDADPPQGEELRALIDYLRTLR